MCSSIVISNLARIFIISLFVSMGNVNAMICQGCLELDDLTFDRVVAKFSTVIVKFDVAFPYGKKHDEYAAFARELSGLKRNDVIGAIVGIKNYGQPTNNLLVERFQVDNKLPAIKLFNNNNPKKWINYPHERNVTVEDLRQFVRMHSNQKLLMDNCLEQFDEYAAQFMSIVRQSPIQPEKMEKFINDIRNAITTIDNDRNKQSAQIYLLIMKRVLEKDTGFIGAERVRLQSLLEEKISERNRLEIELKLNVLSAFIIVPERKNAHNEL